MMKKILVVQGGGRPNGNTSQLIASFVKGGKEAGHQTEIISLVKNEVKPCLGCFTCQTGKPCVINDNFNKIVPKLKEADLLVLATPMYYYTFSSRIKSLVERMFSLMPEKYPKDFYSKEYKEPTKDIALLCTAVDSEFWVFEQMVSYYRFNMIKFMGFRDKGMVLAGGCIEDENHKGVASTRFLEEAYQFGKKIY